MLNYTKHSISPTYYDAEKNVFLALRHSADVIKLDIIMPFLTFRHQDLIILLMIMFFSYT